MISLTIDIIDVYAQDIDIVPLGSEVEINLDDTNKIPQNTYESYTGDYEVIPQKESQVLKTKDKLMSDDVTIKEIPFFEVSNLAGGTTCYIGKEVI